MIRMKRIETFEEFWPFYVMEHKKPETRRLHFVGTTVVIGLLASAVVLRKAWPVALAPLAGYGPAWFSHFFIEKNKPASFKYPLYSLVADFVMWSKIVRGSMDAEVERIEKAQNEAKAEAKAQAETHAPAEPASVLN